MTLALRPAGNIRELENVVERAVILSLGPVLEVDAQILPASADSAAPTAQTPVAAPPGRGGDDELLTLEESQRRHIRRTLLDCEWVIEGPKGAAQILGLHPNTLRSQMKKLGIRR